MKCQGEQGNLNVLLLTAVMNKNLKEISYLIEQGASVFAGPYMNGYSIIEYAKQLNYPEVLEIFKEKGVLVDHISLHTTQEVDTRIKSASLLPKTVNSPLSKSSVISRLRQKVGRNATGDITKSI